jgi:hypothetical protein
MVANSLFITGAVLDKKQARKRNREKEEGRNKKAQDRKQEEIVANSRVRMQHPARRIPKAVKRG